LDDILRNLVILSIVSRGDRHSLVYQSLSDRHLVEKQKVIDRFNEVLPALSGPTLDLLDCNIRLSDVSFNHGID
jgi:hypothetical protein